MKKKRIIKLLVLVSLLVSFSSALSPVDEHPTEDIQIEPISQVAEKVEVEPIQITEKSDEKQQKFSSTECTKKVEECQKKLSNPYSIILFIVWVSVILLFLFLLIKHNKDNEKPVLLILLYFSLLSIALISLLISFTPELNTYFLDKIDNNSVSKIGAIGDMFGSLNTIFSGLTVIGVFTAIYLQRKELKEMQKEFEKQNKTLKLQQFENTFFQLLENHRNLVKSLAPQGINKDIELFHFLSTQVNDKSYKGELKKYENQFFHYFLNLYQLIKFVDKNKSQLEGDFKQYTNIIRAQLSPNELKILFYNGLMEGNENFKGFIEDYKLLKHLNVDIIKDKKLLNLYKNGSFKYHA